MDCKPYLLHISAMRTIPRGHTARGARHPGADGNPVEHFQLYGEHRSGVEPDFLHVEPIRERSGRHQWTIRPHAHPDHAQILHVATGGGSVCIEGEETNIEPPALIVFPAGVVHEIRFLPGTDGAVVTASTTLLRKLARSEAHLFDALAKPGVFRLEPGGTADAVADAFACIQQEFVWEAKGRLSALEARMLIILVDLARIHSRHDSGANPRPDRDLAIVQRYRELLEANFHREKTVAFYASGLGVTAARLNAACQARLGRSASEVLHDRILTEAKRYLLYTERTVAETGHAIGFEDPAYFNRFFARRVGMPPGVYRAHAGRERNGGAI